MVLASVLVLFQYGAVRIEEDHLARLALYVLEEAAAEVRYQQVRRSPAIRFALAYLASRKPGERWPFDAFWRALDGSCPRGRSSDINSALNAIYLRIGHPRTTATMSAIEFETRKRLKPPPRYIGDG